MNILLIGSGGRENALAYSLKKSNSCSKLFSAPGNPGIVNFADLSPLDLNDFTAIINFCKANTVELVVIGPEQPISMGMSDAIRNAGIDVFAPSLKAGMLEISKGYAKDFMAKYGIPTASYKVFKNSEYAESHNFIENSGRVVIKADGLAAGKGVLIPITKEEGHQAIDEIFSGVFGDSGNSIVIEEFMEGDEASIFAICDGNNYIVLPASQDHKRIGDEDTGKNTGGMGAYSPTKLVTPELLTKIENEIIKPTLIGMAKDGCPFIGCLFIGLMIKDGEAKVVEYNCRFGDPETESVMALVQGDLAKLFRTAAKGNIDKESISISNQTACTVIMASYGYPDSFEKEKQISGLENGNNHTIVFHCGTKSKDEKVFSNGGRVLAVTGIGSNLQEAIERAYSRVATINFENAYYRKDIGKKGMEY